MQAKIFEPTPPGARKVRLICTGVSCIVGEMQQGIRQGCVRAHSIHAAYLWPMAINAIYTSER